MAPLTLVLLGPFSATIGARVVALPLKKAQALLAYLALTPGQRHARERLAALLWGDVSDEQARNSLRQTLFAIRAALGRSASHYLGGDATKVWLEPGAVDADALAFERLAAQDSDTALAQAAALYRGDLLDDVAIEADAFDEWLAPERERLRRTATMAMAKLLQRRIASSAVDAAIGTAARLLAIDPLQEVAHRALIRLYADTGRRAEAIRQYHTCVGLLQRELQTKPEPATEEVYRLAVGDQAGRPAPIE